MRQQGDAVANLENGTWADLRIADPQFTMPLKHVSNARCDRVAPHGSAVTETVVKSLADIRTNYRLQHDDFL